MSEITVGASSLGNNLHTLLSCADIVPGEEPSYQICKTLLAYHPLGQKMAEAPITIAQSQARKIAVGKGGSEGVQEKLVQAFVAEWERLGADEHIKNHGKLSRAYGVASIGLLCAGTPPDRPINWPELWQQEIAFNVWDPLNTAGSLVLNQNPNDLDFQKINAEKGLSVSGTRYHRSRTVTLLNEKPLYIEYTNSAFGYVGRSVYQRALYPLKTYIQTMVVDDMISLKAGVLINKSKSTGSIVDAIMGAIAGQKREMVKEARTFNVLTIDTEEAIESLNLQNLDGAFGMARKDCIDNIATAADMPAIILNQETFAEGFGEGVEDSKRVVQYVNGLRTWLRPAYALMDKVCMHRAWTPEFYAALQAEFPDQFKAKTFRVAFYEWQSSFTAPWPSLIEEPESELAKVDDVKLKATIAAVEVLAPLLSPRNRVVLVMWAADCFNERKTMFPKALILDMTDQLAFAEQQGEQAANLANMGEEDDEKSALTPKKPEQPFSAKDSARVRLAVDNLTSSVDQLPPARVLSEMRELRRKVEAG